MKEIELTKIIIDFIHSETGWGNPLRPHCEFEDLNLREIEQLPDDKIRASFRYHFDEDGFSQYDKTHVFDGKLVVDATGGILESTLIEIHTGVATNRDPYRAQ